MARLVVRHLEDEAKTRLRRRAARHGRSVEEEVHDILQKALKNEEAPLPLDATEGPGFKVEETSIAGLEIAYHSGQTTAHAVTQSYLNRIAAYDKRGPLINALVTVNPHALQEADQLDAILKATGKLVGPLHGIPVIVKDNIDVVGLPMTSGFQGWKNYYPPEDAPLVKKIRAAGGIVLAKSTLSEFAMGGGDNINSVVSGFSRNPYNTAFSTGGSSGGTAAALAASFGVVGVGTDTGGSVRMPSAHNALAGLRPTVGLVSRMGMVPLNSVRDTPGPMARSVTDMAILLDVIAGPDPEDAATARTAGFLPSTYTSGLKTDALRGARLGCSGKSSRPQLPIRGSSFTLKPLWPSLRRLAPRLWTLSLCPN